MNRKLIEALQDSEKGREFLRAMKEAKKRGRALKAETLVPLPGQLKAQRRKDRNERAAKIREEVFERAAGLCEWCLRPYMTCEWHHLKGGGERRFVESIENTCAICWDDHRGWERNDLAILRRAKEWAIRQGLREALQRIEKKIAKVAEARRTPSVPVRVETEGQ